MRLSEVEGDLLVTELFFHFITVTKIGHPTSFPHLGPNDAS